MGSMAVNELGPIKEGDEIRFRLRPVAPIGELGALMSIAGEPDLEVLGP